MYDSYFTKCCDLIRYSPKKPLFSVLRGYDNFQVFLRTPQGFHSVSEPMFMFIELMFMEFMFMEFEDSVEPFDALELFGVSTG